MPLNWYLQWKKIIKIWIIFDFESQKSGFFNRHLPNIRWSAKKIFLWKSAIFYSIKLPFDAEVVEKILNGIYSTDLSLLKEFSKKISCEDFHNFILTGLSRSSGSWFRLRGFPHYFYAYISCFFSVKQFVLSLWF